MSGRLSPRTVAITDQILATLADEGGLPISTPDLWRKISPYRPRSERLAAIAAGELVPGEVSTATHGGCSAGWPGGARWRRSLSRSCALATGAGWPEAQPGAGLPELEARQ